MCKNRHDFVVHLSSKFSYLNLRQILLLLNESLFCQYRLKLIIMVLSFLTVLLTGTACVTAAVYNAADHSKVWDRSKEIQKNLELSVDIASRPYESVSLGSEATCGVEITKCNPVYFSKDRRVLRATDIQVFPQSNVDGDWTAISDRPPQGPFDNFAITESKAKTVSTTKGWKIGFKLVGEKSFTDLSKTALGKIAGEISGEYGEQYTSGETFTRAVTRTKQCPPGHHCTLQTISYYAEFTGVCQVVPIINCGGRKDACLLFRLPLPDGKFSSHSIRASCPQFTNYSDRHCPVTGYREEPCKVKTQVLDYKGEPYTHMVSTEDPLKQKDENVGQQRREGTPEEPKLVFLDLED